MFQTTIKYPVSCYGIGVHSGKVVQLTLKPAKANQGIVFIRTDILSEENFVSASFLNVTETSLCTTISNKNSKFSISTIEHLLAAIWGSNIDNVVIEIDGSEVPIMDGSSKPFVFMLECAQVRQLNEKRRYLKINKDVYVSSEKGSESIAEPSNKFMVNIDIEFASKAIGKQSISYSKKEDFAYGVAGARTFGFIEELEYLRSLGLAKGASLDNAIGLDKDIILNHDGLRYEDEFVRHKLLDSLGDFATGSMHIVGDFKCYKPGHSMNNLLLHKIFDDEQNYSWRSLDEL